MPFSIEADPESPLSEINKISLKPDFKPFCDRPAKAVSHLVHTGYHARRNNETGNSETVSAEPSLRRLIAKTNAGFAENPLSNDETHTRTCPERKAQPKDQHPAAKNLQQAHYLRRPF